jgi:hypothetical protein
MHDQHDNSDDDQQVNQRAGHVKNNKSKQPADDQYGANDSKHDEPPRQLDQSRLVAECPAKAKVPRELEVKGRTRSPCP